MNVKLVRRTIRNFIFRNKPYHAHLNITHRCNIRCRYCQITRENLPEFDFQKTKKIIDILDNMGIAMLSITGGEPLLREDVYDIIDYAKSKGLYVRIASNGTLPLVRYEKLINSKIDGISISLDGIDGNDLPHSCVSPKILETLRYLHGHKGKKGVSVLTVLHRNNMLEIMDIVTYLKENLPEIRTFVQPIIVGDGELRVNTEKKADLVNMKNIKNMETLDPEFFIDACIDYCSSEKYLWKCKAGELFFQIQSNGDFWICPDFATPLNILDEDFLKRWRKFDFVNSRKRCTTGCVYSCHYITQKSFEIKNLFSMLKLYKKYKKK